MIRPLVAHACAEFLRKRAEAVFGDDRCAEVAQELINAMADLRVDVIGSAAQNDDGLMLLFCRSKVFLRLLLHGAVIRFIFGVSGIGSFCDLLFGERRKILCQNFLHPPAKLLFAVKTDKVGEEAGLGESGDVEL